MSLFVARRIVLLCWDANVNECVGRMKMEEEEERRKDSEGGKTDKKQTTLYEEGRCHARLPERMKRRLYDTSLLPFLALIFFSALVLA